MLPRSVLVLVPCDDLSGARQRSRAGSKCSANPDAAACLQVDPSTGEIAGVFESIQPSDTDLGAKAPKDVKIAGVASPVLHALCVNSCSLPLRPSATAPQPQ